MSNEDKNLKDGSLETSAQLEEEMEKDDAPAIDESSKDPEERGEERAKVNARKAFERHGKKKEIKNQHVSIFLKPSLYKTFKKICEDGQMSMNSTVTMLIEEFIEEVNNQQD